MIINSSTIGMESARSYTSVNMRASSFGARRSDGARQNNLFGQFLFAGNEQNSFMPSVPQASTRAIGQTRGTAAVSKSNDLSLRTIKQQCIMYILDLLSGGHRCEKKQASAGAVNDASNQTLQTISQYPLKGTFFTTQELYYEQEITTFQTTASVVTGDGRTLDFQLEFEMSREFLSYYEESVSLENIQLLDPLVINLDTNVASVSDQKFFFDLDADGKKESISRLQAGSGYLALDLNGNGMIDDGKELFGTASGDGFLDLSRYDDDSNGWIDEKDAIFDKLLIWSMDDEGNSELFRLKEKDVGALYLGRVSTEHALKNDTVNRTNGVLRSTGLFLYENGTAGTLQQLDLAR